MPSGLLMWKSRFTHRKKVGKVIPKRDWQGKGLYYFRGKKQGFAKYSKAKDLKRGSKKTAGHGKMKHTHDRKKRKKR